MSEQEFSTTASESEGGKFHLVPAGTIQGVCFAVWGLGRQKIVWEGKEKILPKVMVAWETEERIASDDEWNGQRFRIYKKYTLTMGEKGNLVKDLTVWRGKAFTEEEKKGFDIKNLVGANCLISIIHNEAKGKTYANVNSVTALPKGMVKIEPENKTDAPEWIDKIRAQAVPVDAPGETKSDEGDIPF